MAKESIGKINCPACNEQADVREQKNGRAYVLCNDPMCGFQGFTRSDHADKKLRGRMTANAAPAQTPAPAAAPQPTAQPQPPKRKGFFDDLADLCN